LTGRAYSAKTLDTSTVSAQANPGSSYGTVKGYIDKIASYDGTGRNSFVRPENITGGKELIILVHDATSPAQWEQLARAAQYGSEHGVAVRIIKRRP
jgi:hypothetical protein